MRKLPRIYVIRHGETEWSATGQHTGGTDVPLTRHGEEQAQRLHHVLKSVEFARVLTSPLQRARRTCELAGYGRVARVEPALVEWNYGEYEGLTRAEIHQCHPGWIVFRDGCPGGETPADIARRADSVVAQIRNEVGNVAIFSHGHFLCALGVRWIGLPIGEGMHFGLNTASISILGYAHENVSEPAILMWNGEPELGMVR